MPKDCGLTSGKNATTAGDEAQAQRAPASARPPALVWHRRPRGAIAWGVALLLVVALSAWLARRNVPLIAVDPTSPEAVPRALPRLSVKQLLAAGAAADWRVVRLSDNTAVLAIEFPNLLAQGLTFNRIAALVEKKNGARGRVLNDAELSALVKSTGDNIETFYQGHDYTDVDLARFYSLATAQQLSLNAQELRLRTLLLQEGLMREEGPGLYAAISRQAVISFSSVQPDNPATPQDELIDPQRRASVLLHEFSHGQFFTRPGYQKACWKFWTEALADSDRQLFRTYLAQQDYDADNEVLMVNETQALLMHTPDPRAFNAAALGVSAVRLEQWRKRFQQVGMPAAADVSLLR